MLINLGVVGFIGMEIIMTLTVYLIFRFHYRRVVERERKVIAKLRSRSTKKHRPYNFRFEKRRHHRISLAHEKCTIRIVDFGDPLLQTLNNKTISADMIDISLGGLKFSCRLDFPIIENVLINISFQAEDKTPIYLVGTVVRKELKHGRSNFFYGVQFCNLTAKEETAIQNFINQKELAKRKLSLVNSR